MSGLRHPHQIRIATSERQPHVFIPSANPRNKTNCVRCGLPRDHPTHSAPEHGKAGWA